MQKTAGTLLLLLMVLMLTFTGCKKKDKPMVDINSIRTDGSHDDRYIFREEIEKEKARAHRSGDPGFK